MPRNRRITLITIAAASLILGSAGLSSAQEQPQKEQRTRAEKNAGQKSPQATKNGKAAAKASQKTAGKAQKNQKGNPGSKGKKATARTRTRAKDLNGTGSGTCRGGSGKAQRSGGSRGSGGGRR